MTRSALDAARRWAESGAQGRRHLASRRDLVLDQDRIGSRTNSSFRPVGRFGRQPDRGGEVLIWSTPANGNDFWQWLGGTDNFTATLLALVVIGGGARAVLRRTLLRRAVFRRQLDGLAIGVNHEYVASLFGSPAFGRLDETGRGSLLWVSPHAYVHVSFESGAAVQLAVTVTDPLLRYDVSHLTWGVLTGRLGHGVRSTIEAESRYVSVGARRRWAVNSYWAGNPGGYLHHSLAYNDASGLGTFPDCVMAAGVAAFSEGTLYGDIQVPESDVNLGEQIDSELVPNTVLVTRDSSLLSQQVFGVDLDEVRHLRRRQTWAEQWHRRRLMRRWRIGARG